MLNFKRLYCFLWREPAGDSVTRGDYILECLGPLRKGGVYVGRSGEGVYFSGE